MSTTQRVTRSSSSLRAAAPRPDTEALPTTRGRHDSASSGSDSQSGRECKRRRVGRAGSQGRRKSKQPTRTRTRTRTATVDLAPRLFTASSRPSQLASLPPTRLHDTSYHRPLLLHGAQGAAARRALLTWFDGVAASRAMPWRKAWLDPRSRSQTETDAQQLRRLLERRAYEVWISEIMLQQTRVAVVIDYWNRWMARWPTIQDLAEATADHVLAAWRGLGYYSRATRIHEAAKLVVGDEQMRGLLPADVAELQAKMPGVGRYTAGAISAIVFGRAAAMVDGNVLRVLSRQLGVLGDVKADKAVVDVMWAAATALVQAVAADPDQNEKPESDADAHTTPPASDRPGRWGQALMELGSTVCTPKPNCSACPISTTCRAFDEGVALAGHAGEDGDTDLSWSGIDDIEEPCTLCGALGDPAEPDVTGPGATKGTRKKGAKSTSKTEAQTLGMIADHARKFPLKAVKKAVREEERLVCIIKCGATGDYLIQRRPGTGLLAGLWEFPSLSVTDGDASSAKRCVARARSFVDDLVQGHVGDEAGRGSGGTVVIEGGARLGSVPWLFSHLKLTMHVHGFVVNGGLGGMDLDMDMDMEQIRGERRWASSEAVEQESMGTGMRRCWQLARDEEAPGC